MWVGESERNLERVLMTLSSLAPCLLWSDEVDQTVGQNREAQSGGDSGTSSRMLARFLEYMGDSARRGQVLWIGTTNRPDLLDPAMQSRFQVCIPFLQPRGTELLELWPELFRQLDREFDGEYSDIVIEDGALDTMSARSLIELISLAGLFADAENGKPSSKISASHLHSALDAVEPEFDNGMMRKIALTSLLMTRWNLLLPWNAMGDKRAIANGWPNYLSDVVDPESGRLRRPEIMRELGVSMM
jgi:SpoVK/Ycf46/Vps4 family AAA+-type ATPase